MNEIWKEIKKFNGYYVSNIGRVKTPYGNILDGNIDNNGYKNIAIKNNGKFMTVHIARLVAEAFIPNPENKPCVDHINTIKIDNRVENLRWVTYKENMRNPITYKRLLNEIMKPERLKNLNQTGKKFSEEHKRKIGMANKNKISPFRKRVKCIETGICYDSQLIAQAETNIFSTSIGKVCLGERKTAGGYHWCFVD